MSVEFTLAGNNLSADRWEALLDQWSEGGDRLYEPVDMGEEGGRRRFFVSGRGSIRGFHVVIPAENGSTGDVDIKLPAMASLHDWRRCYAVIERALVDGGGVVTREGDQSYAAAGTLTAARAEADGRASLEGGLALVTHHLQAAEGPLHLPAPAFKLTISADDIRLAPAALTARLQADFTRFGEAFQPTMRLGGGGAEGYGAAWALIPSIMPKLDWLMIPAENGDMLQLSWSSLEVHLGDRMEAIGDDAVFLPGADELGPEIIAGLRRDAAAPKVAEPDTEATKDTPTAADTMKVVLVSAPLAVVLVVAGADGRVQKKELQAAIDFMTRTAREHASDAVRQVFTGCLKQLEPMLESLPASLPMVMGSVRKAIEILLPDEDQVPMIDALVALMEGTAGAAGGFFGFGSKISAAERKSIARVEALLRGSHSSD